MINKLLELSLRNRFLVVVVFLGLGLWGWWRSARSASIPRGSCLS